MNEEEENKKYSTKSIISKEEKISFIKEYLISGMHSDDFAISKNIGKSTFRQWRGKFREETGDNYKIRKPYAKSIVNEGGMTITSLLKEQEKSGNTIDEFCEIKKIDPKKFYEWKNYYNNKEKKSTKSPQLSFQKLEMVEDKKQLPPSLNEEKTNDFIQITVGNDIKLLMPKSTDLSQIINLVKGLNK
jgi:transposase-like protein